GTALAIVFTDGQVADSRVVLSGGAPVPWRSREVEAIIKGRHLDQKTAAEAADALVNIAEPLGQNDYKIPLFRGMLTQELMAIA
ncbi:xanthine dehydrogenase family protein subunit M, partial [Thermodesulfobacteriota bacterium]